MRTVITSQRAFRIATATCWPTTVEPLGHFTRQVLRTVKHSTEADDRTQRPVPSRRPKDGTFLTDLVEGGLLSRVTGAAGLPFEATYKLTEQGERAAEYDECETPVEAKVTSRTRRRRSEPRLIIGPSRSSSRAGLSE